MANARPRVLGDTKVKVFAKRRIGTVAIVGVIGLLIGGVSTTALGAARSGPTQAEPQEMTDQAKGEAALARARQHMEAGEWSSAAVAYGEALQYLPGNEEAQAGLRQAQTQLDRGSTIEDVETERRVLREQARVEFNDAMTRAAELLAQEDFEAATRIALTARIRLRERQGLFQPSEYEGLSGQADKRLSDIDEAREIWQLAEQERVALEAQRDQLMAERADQHRRELEINERLRRVRQLQQEEKYEEALQVIDEILFLDDLHPTALLLKDVLETTAIYKRYVELQRRKEMVIPELALQNQERLRLPHRNLTGPGMRGISELLQYPEDWSQISIMRYNESGFHDTPEDRAVAQRLDSTTVPLDFTNNTFEQVVNFLENVAGVTMYVDWKNLNPIGVDRENEISLQLDEVTVATALDRVLEQLGDDIDRPQYAIQDGIVTISSDEALRKRVLTVVYDIRDLLFEVPYFDNAPTLDLDSALNQGGNQGGGGGGGSGGGGGGFGGGGGGGGSGGGGQGGGGGSIFGEPGTDPTRRTREELIEQIVNIIQENVDPEGWRDLGGDTGSLQELNGNLIITNTPKNHRLIEGLLAQLREIRALQINIETRVLTVGTDWFEQIGVDLDLYFNTNEGLFSQARAVDPLAQLGDFFDAEGQLKDPLVYDAANAANFEPDTPVRGQLYANQVAYGSQFGIPVGDPPTGITYITGPAGAPIRTSQGFTPIGVTQNSLDLLSVIGQTTDFGSSILGASPALVTGLQFLDDIQVDLLIQATQADQRSMILTAPRLTFFNGQRAWLAITRQQAFVSGLQAITGDAAGAFQPIIGRISQGFVLDVEAVISSDRRYVTITVIFGQAEIQGFEETAFTGAAGGGGGAAGGGNAAQFGGTVQLPIIEVSEIRTTVSVPDKGTVLLGGQRVVSEYETETGVPVLSKIPFINRFFTNRVTSKAEQTLLILIRPEIIIQQENEDILFPGLSDTIGSGGSASYLR